MLKLHITNLYLNLNSNKKEDASDVYLEFDWQDAREIAKDLGVDFKKVVGLLNSIDVK